MSLDEHKNQLTHVDEQGQVRMVNVGDKLDTKRLARAQGCILMKDETLSLIIDKQAPKGDVLACARIAGIMAAKKTAELIPMCHPLLISSSKIEMECIQAGEREDGRVGIRVFAEIGLNGKTGIEMEALCAVSLACLTIYDMCKAVDKGMEITDVYLLRKEGGKSGLWQRDPS